MTESFQQRLKVKFAKVLLHVKCTMLYRMETVAVIKKQVGMAKLKMARLALGVTKKDKIKNE